MRQIILFNKPYNVLSQFTDQSGRSTLKDYIDLKGFYPAGRLDRDSEGLLVLTNDGQLQHKISNPKYSMGKVYLAQVEGQITQQALQQLKQGIQLKDGVTLPAKVKKIKTPNLWDRVPPVRYRKTVPDSWVKLCIYEGRNRQVRRMLAAVGFPCLRLVRRQVGDWHLNHLLPGQYQLLKVE